MSRRCNPASASASSSASSRSSRTLCAQVTALPAHAQAPDREVGGNIKSAGHPGNVPQRPPTRGGNRGSVPCGVIPRRGLVVLLALATVGLASCSGDDGDASRAPRDSTASSTTTSAAASSTTTTKPDPCAVAPVVVAGTTGQSVFVDDANFVTSLAWAPDGRLFFAERGGAIKVARDGKVTTFATVPTVTTERGGGYSERGLLGLALSPTFATDHFVYAFYSRTDYSTQVVVRFADCAGTASEPTTLISLPAGPGCCHKGGRLVFGPDGKLFVTLGDELATTASSVNSETSVPQDPSDVRGKILRYNADGTDPRRQPLRPDESRRGRPASATCTGSPSTPRATSSRSRTGPPATSARPAHGYDLAFMVERGGRYQWPACYGYSHLVPGATSCLGPARAQLEQRGRHARADRRDVGRRRRPGALREPLRVLQRVRRDAGVRARRSARVGAVRARTNASSTSSRAPTTPSTSPTKPPSTGSGTDTTHQ